MFTLSDKLTSKKLNRGYIGLENDELCFELDENNFPIAVNSRQVGKGQELIENFMIAANEAISVMAGTLPFPFRNHGFPDPDKLNETLKDIENIDLKLCSNLNGNSNQVLQVILESLKDKDNFIVISRLILFSLQKAYYSSNNIGHFGLALESYTHSTAPIRRIVDYWVHHLLDLYEEQNLTNEELNDLYVTVENICSHASLKERETDLLAYQVDKLEMAKYMSKRIGEGYKMFIQDIRKSHLIVRAKGLNEGIVKYNDFDGFAAKIKRKKMILGTDGYLYKIGDSLDVNVKSASIEDGKVYYKAKLPSYENEAVEVIRVRE
jgi:ribonuclease R